MKVVGLNGREYNLDLKKYIKNERSKRSFYHLRAREIIKDIFTGSLSGEPTFSKGKVRAVKNWCSENNLKIEESIFYSDSINDLPMLESCGIPIVVNPDDNLKKIALDRSYKILNR